MFTYVWIILRERSQNHRRSLIAIRGLERCNGRAAALADPCTDSRKSTSDWNADIDLMAASKARSESRKFEGIDRPLVCWLNPLGKLGLAGGFEGTNGEQGGLEGGALPGARRPRGSGDGHWKEDTVCLIMPNVAPLKKGVSHGKANCAAQALFALPTAINYRSAN